MANAFNPSQAVEVSAAMLEQDSYLSALVSRDTGKFFSGGGAKGRTVDVKIPTTLIARQRGIDDKTSAIVVDEITESLAQVTLGTHVYNAIGLSEGDLSLNIKDYAAQVLRPQMDAVVDGVEEIVANFLMSRPEVNVATGSATAGEWPIYDAANPIAWLTAVRKVLRAKQIPFGNLNFVLGTSVYADFLNTDKLTDASQSGSTQALREGAVGRVRGLNLTESTRVADDDVLIFPREAVVLANRAPLVPQGATFGATRNSNGYDLRYLRDYDADHTQDRSIVGTFAGIAEMPFYTITRDYTAGTAGVVESSALFHLSTGGDTDAAPAEPATDA